MDAPELLGIAALTGAAVSDDGRRNVPWLLEKISGSMRRRLLLLGIVLAVLFGQAALSAQPSLGTGSVSEAAQRLKAGEFLWAPQVAPDGPTLFVVSLAAQRAVLYRNGIPIGITTVSTGRPGHRTPTGIFTVLERDAVHYSSIYRGAPMPNMQRLTSYGIALHGGDLPGYPASHGCIRLPREFARLMFGVTRLGMTVVITNEAALPHIVPAGNPLRGTARILPSGDERLWRPEAARTGPVSIVISAADRRVVVLRNSAIIGSAPVTIDGRVSRTAAYMLQADGTWLRILLPGQAGEGDDLRDRIHAAAEFRRSVESVVRPGTTVVITPDSLRTSGTGSATPLLQDE